MKSKLLRTVLEWGLATSVILSSYFFVRLYFQTKQQRAAAGEVAEYQANNTKITQLVNELVEYSRTHPDMEKLLESYGIKRNPAAAPATPAKPAGK